MKLGKVILSVAGATAAICSAFAFKAKVNPGHTQLFTLLEDQANKCTQINLWTSPTGSPTPAGVYTDPNCQHINTQNVTATE